MGKHFNKAAREQFALRMKELADFEAESVTSSGGAVYPGERCFKRMRGDFAEWVCLITSPKGYNDFFVECGYSRKGRFPHLSMRPSIYDLESEVFSSEDEGFFRLRTTDEEFEHTWGCDSEALLNGVVLEAGRPDLEKEEAADIVNPLVDAAFEVLLTRGLPVLSRID